MARAREFLEAEMDAGRMRRSDPRLLLVSAYSTVVGVATEVEVLRAVGIEPTLRSTVIRRRELLAFLHSALVAPDATRPDRTLATELARSVLGNRNGEPASGEAGQARAGGGDVDADGLDAAAALARPCGPGSTSPTVQTHSVRPSLPPRAQA